MLDKNSLFKNKYIIKGILGRGGMGSVYLAERIDLKSKCTIKEIDKIKAKVDVKAEPQILKGIKHQNLPVIYDIFDEDDYFYMILDYIEGESLDVKLSKAGRFNEKQVVYWGNQIANVLEYLHNQQNPIIHQDIKPGNIIIDTNGNANLIDFGISQKFYSEENKIIGGTNGYMAPEIIQHKCVANKSTDIYSLGITLIQLLTGINPESENFGIDNIADQDKNFSSGFEHILRKMTDIDSKRRYSNTITLINDLNNMYKFNNLYKKKKLARKLEISIIAAIVFLLSTITFFGYKELQNRKLIEYKAIITKGNKLLDQKNYSEAKVQFDKAINKYKNNSQGYEGISNIYLSELKYDECISYIENTVFRKISTSKTNPQIYYILGTAYYENEDYELAATNFEKATKLDNSVVDYLRDLSVCYARLGQYEKADEILDIIKNNNKIDDISLYVEGQILLSKENYLDAIKSYQSCIEIASNDEIMKKAYFAIAEIYRKNLIKSNQSNDKLLNVLNECQSAIKDKNDIRLVELLGDAYFRKGNTDKETDQRVYFKKSITEFKKLIDLGYKRSYIYLNIAKISQQLNDFDTALEYLNYMNEEYPNDYKCFAQFSFLYADIEANKDNDSRNYKKTADNYNLAIKYCPRGKEADLSQLKKLINELKKNNWLE